jgi:hypothetical protein
MGREKRKPQEVDILPEFVRFKDTGCKLYSSCLECPLEKCKEDEPITTQRKRQRNKEIRERVKRGERVSELVQEYGISEYSIMRILRK